MHFQQLDNVHLIFVLNIIIGGGKGLGFEVPGILDLIEKYQKQKNDNEEKKIEKEKIEIEFMQELYGDDLKTLDIGTIDNEMLDKILKAGQNIEKNKTDNE